MIVQNQIGGGGPKIPEGTFVIVKGYTNAGGNVSASFNVPLTGTYRITTIASGGAGSMGDGNYDVTGAGGGSGGWACSIIALTKGSTVPVTCNASISSFGSYLSATSGATANGTIGGNGGTASGGNVNNNSGIKGNNGKSDVATKGGNGAPIRNPSSSEFLTDTYGEAGSGSSIRYMTGAYPQSLNLFAPFGAGGGGGASYFGDEGGEGSGGPGAVIIELLLEGVNT